MRPTGVTYWHEINVRQKKIPVRPPDHLKIANLDVSKNRILAEASSRVWRVGGPAWEFNIDPKRVDYEKNNRSGHVSKIRYVLKRQIADVRCTYSCDAYSDTETGVS